MKCGDTIAAISSAAGPASRMIVRTSGPASFDVARQFSDAFSPQAAEARLHRLVWNQLAVPAWLYTFVGPRSYTGEDMVEYHLPGNPLLARMVLDELLRYPGGGVRAAEAGEFTARAHFNGKLPLEACEGVAAAIHASNQLELSAARKLLAGELAGRLSPLREMLIGTLALVEAQIDFSEEGISFLQQSELRERLKAIEIALSDLLANSPQLQKLAHEPRVLLVGRPNAGKSTLLNKLCGMARAVVSDEAGTTRDVIWATAALRRGLVQVADAAGVEPIAIEGADAPSAIAQQMQLNALRATERADVLVLIRDGTDAREPIALPRRPDLVVRSKIDLSVASPPSRFSLADAQADEAQRAAAEPQISVSAQTGSGIADLLDTLDRLCFGESTAAASLALTGRHVASIELALEAIDRAASHIDEGSELLALELREALDAIGEVLGHITPDDLLGKIFSTFCIGK